MADVYADLAFLKRVYYHSQGIRVSQWKTSIMT